MRVTLNRSLHNRQSYKWLVLLKDVGCIPAPASLKYVTGMIFNMKATFAIATLAGLVFSASALAVTPTSYDTKFNVSANVPDSTYISDGDGNPVTEVDVVLEAVSSGFMEAKTDTLFMRSNDKAANVTMTLDDSVQGKNEPFKLWSSDNGLQEMSYKITANAGGSAAGALYAASGDVHDFTLANDAGKSYSQSPVIFHFVSDEKSVNLAQGNYKGVVYANVAAKP
ncbi:hypothetical protein QNH14_21865 [Apirhabdus apintestini]|nr:hypothetical protein QNH14_21865 [Enterobacteriaceae bacterium CA-0114]